jgi:IMP cyclohydrolase
MVMVLLEHKTAPTLRIQMFLVVTLSGKVNDSRRFGEVYRLHPQASRSHSSRTVRERWSDVLVLAPVKQHINTDPNPRFVYFSINTFYMV